MLLDVELGCLELSVCRQKKLRRCLEKAGRKGLGFSSVTRRRKMRETGVGESNSIVVMDVTKQ